MCWRFQVRRLYSSLSKEVAGWTQVDATQSIEDLSRQVIAQPPPPPPPWGGATQTKNLPRRLTHLP